MSDVFVDFSDDSFENDVLKSDLPVLVDFWAEWCGPCKMLTPVIEEIAAEFNGKIKCGKVNVDNCPNTASSYGIRSIPSLLFFKNGKVEEQLVGAVPKQQIVDILNKLG
ncbi:MAG: thioredoxin [Candidatus Marinimicrobia bacterium]|nr:thioredoxin [Candidatus Neomarinimicrobiota bacterium]|tara:strand:- start:287 stop:613 length:327 start_codon:yes stop_codon:yes gene_type:complete